MACHPGPPMRSYSVRPARLSIVLEQTESFCRKSAFTSSAQFYRTFFHELVHSTGHPWRLNRFAPGSGFETEERGLEELVAEMGAAMLLAECGIFEDCAEKNASYCQHWFNQLKADPKLIVKAAGKAQRAVDLILGRQSDQADSKPEHCETLAMAA
jgi:antirestriction protein ArdC